LHLKRSNSATGRGGLTLFARERLPKGGLRTVAIGVD
jgi:hypothetical protein